jgi:PPM family protein phosphatase
MSDDQEVTAPLELENLQSGWAAKADARPVSYAYLIFGGKTDLGRVRENNEDKWEFLEPDDPAVLATKGRVFAVADGMGGHAAGQIAAEMVLNTFIRTYYSHPSEDVEASLQYAVREANRYVVEIARTVPGRSGMGATLTAVVIRDDQMYIAQVGDSRCYLLRAGELEQLTEDHSWVAEQVRAGNLTEAEAESSPFRNVITRSMGGAPEAEPDIAAFKMLVGDRYLLCSDGLSGMVADAELGRIMAEVGPSSAVWKLVERANQGGGKDNITAVVIEVVDIQPWPREESEPEAGTATANGHHPEQPEGMRLNAPASADPAEAAGASNPADRPGLMNRLFGKR